MTRSLAIALLAAVALPGAAAAQPEGRFRTGALAWTPTLTLRDAGVDTNVYDEATNPKRDHSAVLSPQVEGLLRLSMMDVRFGGGADFVYFQRYTSERSVNTRANVRLELRGSRLRPFARAAFLDSRERVNSEIDVRARRADRDLAAGAGIELTPRGLLQIGGSVNQSTFRQGEAFRGVDLAHRMNRQSAGGTLRFRYEVTPLTGFILEGEASRDRFRLSPGYDADNLTARAGFEFEPDAVLKGRATVGFHRITPLGTVAFGFEGVTAGVELGYVLLQRTRVDVRIARDTSHSFEAQPYFLHTLYGGEILHTLVGPVDLIGRATWETLAYPGIAERALPAERLEVTRYGGAIAIRPGMRVHVTLNYELTERRGDLRPDRHYDRRRLYTNVTYGF
ncbi:MAG: outer membrane beta-barrel protein [Vicinamibacterales bacterium]